jgi:hypothetical protein
MDITEAIKLKGARIQILISEDTPQGKFNDALYYGENELSKLDEKAVKAAVQTRVNNWVAFVTEQSSKPPIKPSVEQLQEQADQIKEQWTRMVTQLAEVGSKEDVQAVKNKLDEAVVETVSAIDATPIKEKLKKDPDIKPVEGIIEEPIKGKG